MGGPAKIDGKFVSETDNFYLVKFKVGDVTYPSSEHYFQANKTVIKKEFDFVLQAKSGIESWSRGNRVTIKDVKVWDAKRVDVMYKGNYEKFKQNEECKKALISTKGKISCGGSSGFWNKWNGILLTRIREEMRDEKDRDEKVLKESIKLMKEFREGMEKKIKKK